MVMLDGSNHTSRSSLSLKAFQIGSPTYTHLAPKVVFATEKVITTSDILRQVKS